MVIVIVMANMVRTIAAPLMLHAHLIALSETLAIVVAIAATYGRVPVHLGAACIHLVVAAHVVASGVDAVLIATATGLLKLRGRCVPLVALLVILPTLIALLAIHLLLIHLLLIHLLLWVIVLLLGMKADGRKGYEGEGKKWSSKMCKFHKEPRWPLGLCSKSRPGVKRWSGKAIQNIRWLRIWLYSDICMRIV